MGALHAGHLSLVRLARGAGRPGDRVDLRQPGAVRAARGSRDAIRAPSRPTSRRCPRPAVDLVWAPTVDVMYPADFAPASCPPAPAAGRPRGSLSGPHFFGGVATVVAKLFLQCLPDIAVFGEKDYQQLKVVTQMAKDLAFPFGSYRARPCARRTASRSRRATPTSRPASARLRRRYTGCCRTAPSASGEANQSSGRWRPGRDAVAEAGFTLDYLEARHAETLAADRVATVGADPPPGRRYARNDTADRQCGGVSRFFRRGRACPGHPDKGTAVPLESRSPEQAR